MMAYRIITKDGRHIGAVKQISEDLWVWSAYGQYSSNFYNSREDAEIGAARFHGDVHFKQMSQ